MIRSTRRRIHNIGAVAAAMTLALAGTACLDDSVTGTRPLTMTLEASATTIDAGQSVTFTYDASGQGITLVTFDYSDGVVDSLTFSGPVEVGGTVSHVFTTAATYAVTATVSAIQGTEEDNVVITVN